MQRTFLTAEWRDLIMANYVVDPSILKSYLPAGTELDDFNGLHFVSLVGFMFKNTRLLGIRIPYHVNFEEVNLRFYVKRLHNGTWKRGVVFIREIVPRYAIKLVANTLYKEQYACMPMCHFKSQHEDIVHLGYHFRQGGKWHKIEANAFTGDIPLAENSSEHFIAQHYWGYARYSSTITYEYEVLHPAWTMLQVNDFMIDCDFSEVYGKDFSFMGVGPHSVFVANGSPITILKKNIIRVSSKV